jgi:hypothetical protein
VDAAGNFYFGGESDSSDWPVRRAAQASYGGAVDSVLTKLSLSGRVQFSAVNYSALEDAGSLTITVARSGAYSEEATVKFAISGGTASEKDDFVEGTGTLRFAAGERTKNFNVQIIDDALIEGDEKVNLRLSAPMGTNLGHPSATSLTIIDNDARQRITSQQKNP